MEKMSKAKKIILSIGIFLLIAVVGLSIALTVIELKRQETNVQLNNLYEKSYYETVDALDNISTKLNKVSVLTGKLLRQELLNDIWRDCDIATTNLCQLSSDDEGLNKAVETLNQIGDYCHYLSKKLTMSDLSDAELEYLDAFNKAVGTINTALASVQDQLITGGKLDSSLLSGITTVTGTLTEIDYSSVDYPELIYDGPFSDGLDDRETKYLTGKTDITVERGAELVASYFSGCTDISNIGVTSTSIPCYMYTFQYNGVTGTVYLSVTGGYVVQYDAYSEITDPTLTDDECLQKAVTYIEQLGYTNMKAVWISNNNSTVYINFAYCENEVVYYPDLVKIKIRSDTGEILGVEAQNFIYNHTARTITIPENIDHINISASLTVKSQTYCLIPTTWNTEVACLEVVASKNEQIFYIYYNLETGEEERVLMVIDEDGQLLI